MLCWQKEFIPNLYMRSFQMLRIWMVCVELYSACVELYNALLVLNNINVVHYIRICICVEQSLYWHWTEFVSEFVFALNNFCICVEMTWRPLGIWYIALYICPSKLVYSLNINTVHCGFIHMPIQVWSPAKCWIYWRAMFCIGKFNCCLHWCIIFHAFHGG